MNKKFFLLVAVVFTVSACSSTQWRGDAVRDRLTQSTTLSTHEVSIDERSAGVISLEGTVSSERDRSEIERLARNTSGVRDVRNNLVVSPSSVVVRDGVRSPSSAPYSPRFTRPDTQINDDVRRALGNHRNIDLRRVDIFTNQGIVTVRGTQNRSSDIQELVALASSVEGVRSVRNELTVSTDRYNTGRGRY